MEWPILQDGETTATGSVVENLVTSTKDSGDVKQTVEMITQWRTGGEYWTNGTWVQNFAQWESVM